MGRICIYCVREQDPSAFNAEHVISRAFGMFEQNLTLNCVCAECNDYFGKTIELAYGRDSVEAFLRLIHGTKPADEVGELSPSRLSITLGGDDDWSGCHIELKEEDGQVAVDLAPQVRFAWTLDPRAVIGQVSLFNGPTHTVILVQSYRGIWRYIRSGHHFDLETRRVSQLAVARRARRRPTL